MHVLWLDEARCQALERTGGKAATLSRLAVKHPVPSGFCVTSDAYRRWLVSGTPAAMPSEVRAAIAAAYEALAVRSASTSTRVAVRSSAIGEDGRSASFAGQYASYLNVLGIDALVEAVGRCWNSAQSEQVHAYRRRQRETATEDLVAVLVQEFIVADVAFVAFSTNPVTGDREEIVINANWGLGEAVADGAVVPDTYIMRKADRSLIKELIGSKEAMTVVCPEGVRTVAVPRGLRKRGTLTRDQAAAVADLTARLEMEMGWPVDVEGAFSDEKIYLLQCRPITTI
jgi:phosphoenolpyruvate synthase/pyruvate phosphate dikinase